MKEDWGANPIDLEEALEIVDGDEELLKEIYHDFLDDYPEVFAKIKEDILRGDAHSLNSSAHKFKGMLKNIAAITASNIAFELEGMGKKQDLSRAGETLERLDEACKGLKAFILKCENASSEFSIKQPVSSTEKRITETANILIIDDDKMLCNILCHHLEGMGYAAVYALTLKQGLLKAASEAFDVVFLDVHLPDGNGLEALPKIREVPSTPEVIIFTGDSDPDGAELAIKCGAWDYIEKPPSTKKMTLPLVRALQYRDEKKKRKPRMSLKREGIIGTSPQLEACLDLVARAVNSDSNVLITGETGTGKELFARAIHQNSPRSNKRFVVVDCAALPGSLVESILFGNEKGAFTGADRAREGLVKQADEGTLFLDEVGELPFLVQKSFLRVIQERQFLPVGAKREIEVDFRLIAATNRDLDEMVRNDQFRSDLLFRLHIHKIEVPPLRARTADIKELAVYYLNKLCESYGTETKGFSPEFLEALKAYQWPGNVRELFNALEEVLSVARHEPTLFPHHLPTYIRAKLARTSLSASGGPKDDSPSVDILKDLAREDFPKIIDFRSTMERQYLQKLMQLTHGSKKEACRLSGLSRTRLFELLKKHNIWA